jgi:hypothetical protein
MKVFTPIAVFLLLCTFRCFAPLTAQTDTHAGVEKVQADRVWAKLAAGNERFVAGKEHRHDYLSQ